MRLFFLAFLLIYSGMHLLVWWGVRPLLPPGRRLHLLLLAWTLLMIAAPPLTRLLERFGWGDAAVATAWIGYLWMGFLWLAFALFTALAAWNGVARFGGLRYPGLRRWVLYGPRPALCVLFLVAATGIWAFFEARELRVETVRLAVGTLPPGRSQLRIVQVSDLHLGLINHRPLLEEVIARARDLQPDLVAVTGDLLDAQPDHLEGLAPLWRQLQPPLGKFAVVGNHEVYAGREHSLQFLAEAGFRLLIDEAVEVDGIQVVGIPDPAWGSSRGDAALLTTVDPAKVTLLLKHRPWIEPAAIDRFTLQLSGHAHRGQIFPFTLLTGLAYPLQDGLYRLGAECWIYTSRGTGSWGPPMRLLSPPELTLIELVAAAKEK
jgi:predicted MPP superfamily phosphohydrolase